MAYKIEALPDSYAKLGEGPHWDIKTQSLYYVDLFGPTLHRYDYKLNKNFKAKLHEEKYASFIIPINNSSNQFAVGCERHVKIVEWNGHSDECIILADYCSVENNEKLVKNRFNDGKCDPFGRLYAGTMHSDDYFNHKTGSLYRCNAKTFSKSLISNIGISNGLTWNLKEKKFYFIDSLAYNIKVYDYDEKTGDISNQRILIDFGENQKPVFIPDGMTIDEIGNIYVALYNGSKIFKINSNGKIELKINMNCKQITSLAFGGPNLDILFVTTAALKDEPAPAGAVFKITGLGVKGLEMTNFKI